MAHITCMIGEGSDENDKCFGYEPSKRACVDECLSLSFSKIYTIKWEYFFYIPPSLAYRKYSTKFMKGSTTSEDKIPAYHHSELIENKFMIQKYHTSL